MEEKVCLEAVNKGYREAEGRREVLRDLDLRIFQGEFVSITGPSGSGKSTLLNILGGVDTADTGRVTVAGEELTGKSESQRTLFRRNHVGIVFQFFNLIPTLTVEENLMLPLALCGRQYNEGLITESLARFGLDTRRHAYPTVLSGGEQQRIAVIRAAIHEPGLILADEPTGNLDNKSGDEVLGLLRDIADEGRSIVMATHSQRASAVADRRLQIRGGRLAESS